ncbi:MAG: right-handed parallel beta-helix repeat-containing protein [bacterium]|nr:right-handed parallel beta-helix repeat-containing protein [bacterium]
MRLNSIIHKENNQWLKIAVFFLLLLLASAFSFYIFNSYREMSDLRVNSNYRGWFKWGSEKYPYNNIHKAIQAASRKKMDSVSIHLKNGEYVGSIEIPENIKIYGESREGVILKNNGPSPVSMVTMKNNSLIANLTVIGGITGILAENQATIENCFIKEFKKIGIDAVSSESEIIVRNAEISSSGGKGLYAQRGRKMQIIGNDIHDNEEEGLDLRQFVSGEISYNKIYNNGESGIESIVGGSYLKISKNDIWGNKSNGITFQYYDVEKKEAEIIIEENKITAGDSDHFAISVANPSGEKNKPNNYWRNSIKIYSNNILEGGIRKRSLEITDK